jgi:hypothetical protein
VKTLVPLIAPINFFGKLKKKLDMPHGGMLGLAYPCKNVSYTLNASPLKGGSYPREPPFFYWLIGYPLRTKSLFYDNLDFSAKQVNLV